MATDAERLAVLIEANTKSYERAMARIEQRTNRAFGSATRSVKTLDAQMKAAAASASAMAGRFAVAFAGAISVRELGRFADSFTRIENALRVAGLEGEQLAQVMDRLFAIARKNGAPVESLAQLYNRLALVQRELGISGEELLQFTDNVAAGLRVAGQSAAQSSGALLQLAQALGSGVVRAEEFNSILEGALPIAQAAARGLEEAGGSVAKLRQLVIDGKVSSEAFFRAFQAGSSTLQDAASTTDLTLSQAFENVRTALIETVGRIDETTGASNLLIGALDQLATDINNLGAEFEALASAGSAVIEFFDNLVEGANAAIPLLQALDNLMGFVADKQQAVNRGGKGNLLTVAGQQPTVSLADFAAPPSRGGGRGGGRDRAAAAAERQANAVRELIADLEHEQRLIGLSEQQRRIENELRQAGAAATEQQRARIVSLVTAIETAERTAAAAKQQLDFLGQAAFDALDSLIIRGAKAKDVMLDLVQTLARAALQASLLGTGPLGALFGGGGGATGGGLFGAFAGLFQHGGTIPRGQWGIVGERGPEIVRGPAAVQPMRGGVETIRIDLNPSEGWVAGVADQRIVTRSGQIIQVAVRQSHEVVRRNFAGMAAQTQARTA